MLRKTSFYVMGLIAGAVLLTMGFLIQEESLKAVAGICIGIGAGFIGTCVSNLVMKQYEKKHPEVKKQNTIEWKDERNQTIRFRAKAKAADLIQWFIIGLVYLMILADVPLWLSLADVGVFVLYHIVSYFYIAKYQKEM